jgi:hypothetical protein
MAWQLWQATGDSDFLQEDLDVLPVLERIR